MKTFFTKTTYPQLWNVVKVKEQSERIWKQLRTNHY